MSEFSSYAPPLIWGPWQIIQNVAGSRGYKISYSVIGDTKVFAKVRYPEVKGLPKKEQSFVDEILIRTADVYDTIEVCFKGSPLGSAVEGEIT